MKEKAGNVVTLLASSGQGIEAMAERIKNGDIPKKVLEVVVKERSILWEPETIRRIVP